MKFKTPAPEYFERAKRLNNEETERLMARMRGRFARRIEDRQVSTLEALALQIEFEDEELAEWRERMAEIRKNVEGSSEASTQNGDSHRSADGFSGRLDG
jgi:hypothetical protein